MRKLRRFLSALLLLPVFATAITSCVGGNGNENDTGDGSGVNTDYLFGVKGYTVVHPKKADVSVLGVAAVLKNEIKQYAKTDVEVSSDSAQESECEIIIGNTSRKESEDLYKTLTDKKSKEAYAVEIVGKKIVIVGITDEDTVLGVRSFMNEYVRSSPAEGYLSLDKNEDTIIKKTGEVLYFTDDYHAVVRQRTSAVYEPFIGSTERFTYGKIVKLQHQSDEKNNGILIATNENSVGRPWDIYRSEDDGKKWTKLDPVRDSINQNVSNGYQPFLFELPEDMGEYKKGTLLFTGCTYTPSQTNIILNASADLGDSWTPICNIARGNGYNKDSWLSDAVWEPYLIFDEETHRLYCFYSDEMDDEHNQRLVYRYSEDLVSWSETCNASALGELRPGMVSVTKMGNGRYAMVGEMVGYTGNWVHIKFADSLDSWNVSEKGTPVTTVSGFGCGGAPQITWTPDGGECGTLILVMHHGVENASHKLSEMFLSFDYGKTWVSIKNPLPVAFNSKTYNSYSPGLFTDKDGNVYYVNNVDLYENAGGEKLVMTKLKMY